MDNQTAGWTTRDIPDQSGRTALITGGNSGLGYQAVLQLARKGARVLLAARDRARGAAALERLAAEAPGSHAELAQLDLADLACVERFSAALLDSGQGLDLLINNAGVMAIPHRETTAQGYERQFGTNHLGHFALTGRLLPALARRPGSRVVTVSSNRHKGANGIEVRAAGLRGCAAATTTAGSATTRTSPRPTSRAMSGPASCYRWVSCRSPAPVPGAPAWLPVRWGWRRGCSRSRPATASCRCSTRPPRRTCTAASTSGLTARVRCAGTTPNRFRSPGPPMTRPPRPGCGQCPRS